MKDPLVVHIISQTDSTVTVTSGSAKDVTYLVLEAEPDPNVAFPWPRDSVRIRNISGIASDFDIDWTSTWRSTDQYLNAGVGESGPSIRYRWKFDGGAWTSYTADTLYDHPGFGSAGVHTIALQTKDLTTGYVAQKTDTIVVSSNLLTMSGPSYVTDKLLKTYTANYVSDWWERYPPTPPGWTFYRTLPPDSTYPGDDEYNRIWAAGDYTISLRNEMGDDNGRGRIDVEVCHGVPGCGAMEIVAPGEWQRTRWPVFGGGPWVGSDGELLRLYELTGLHDRDSPFASASWLQLGASGSAVTGAWEIRWTTEGDENYRRIAFTAASSTLSTFAFGMSIDPDLGRYAADDLLAFDPVSGIVTIHDADEALAVAITSDGSDAVSGLNQYGARSVAPRSRERFSNESVAGRFAVLEEPDDVQIVLRTSEVQALGAWELHLARAATPEGARSLLEARLSR